jgi:hypothetical protein
LGFDQGNKQAKRGRGGVVVILFRGFWVDVAFQIGHIASKKKEEKSRHRTRDLLRFVPRLEPLVQTNKISVLNLIN